MNLAEIVEAGLGEGGAAMVLAGHSRSVNCRLANNTVTTNGREESVSCGAVAINSDQVGVQAADVHAKGHVLRLARAARERAASSPKAPDAMPLLTPAEAAQPEAGAVAELGEEEVSLEPILDPLRRALERSRRGGLQLYGYAEATEQVESLGTETGVRLTGERRSGAITLTLKTADLKRSVWAGALGTELAQVDVERLYSGLEQRLGWTEHKVQLDPGHYEVILEPSATADMLLRLGWEMHARGADEERTVFAGRGRSRVGETMYAPHVTVESDPSDPKMPVPGFVRAMASSEYSSIFDNGLTTGRTVWVDKGVQQELICPRRWAKDHHHPVRPDCENLRLRGSDTALEEMIVSTKRALLIASLWYVRDVDPSTLLLTGLTRDGVFLIENGKVVGAVNNFRFNESPVGVLQRTTEIGRTEMALSREIGAAVFVEAPPLRVEGFFMSSVSDAI